MAAPVDKHIVIGTAGHIDHGKSSLVKAITGIDPDRLKEEKERGITIDIGFAHAVLSGGVHVGFVDVPGHERFVHNMLTGVSGVDAILLVIAATESIMPQTREHLEICSLMGIPCGVVALTKVDLVDEDILDVVELETMEFLKGTFLEGAPVVRVSSETGAGLQRLTSELATLAHRARPRDIQSVFRMPVDRSFTVAGMGTVVTGTVTSGAIEQDSEVAIYPAGKTARVRRIQVHGAAVQRAAAGQRAAVNLNGIEVGEVCRGMQLSVPGRFKPAKRLRAMVSLSSSSPTGLKARTGVRIHLGTAEVIGIASPVGTRRIGAGEQGLATIALAEGMLAVIGDRFVLRRASPITTIGGGIVIGNAGRRDPKKEAELARCALASDRMGIIAILARSNGRRGLSERDLLARLLIGCAVVRTMLDQLDTDGSVVILSREPHHVMDSAAFQELCDEALRMIVKYCGENVIGLPREHLSSSLFRECPKGALDAVLHRLAASDRISVLQDRLQSDSGLKADDEQAMRFIEDTILSGGWQPPQIDAVVANARVSAERARNLVQLLIQQKHILRISEAMAVHRQCMDELKTLLSRHMESHGGVDVGEFKTLTGLSRRYAIPLLDYLDREHFTQRIGDRHCLVRGTAAANTHLAS
jgi:selenocysteine-specific elongation factor